jgi:hypothetical protein
MQQQNKITGWLNKRFKVLVAVGLVALQSLSMSSVQAAAGEMGRGIPSSFATYSTLVSNNNLVIVWQLTSPTIAFPAGCTALYLSSSTMGIENFKAAIAILTAANIAGRAVRFYAHAERDGGCGVDYVQLG